MTRVFSRTEPLDAVVFDVYCAMEERYSEKFLYMEKDGVVRVMGLGCLIAEESLAVLPHEYQGSVHKPPVLFAAGVFDPDDTKPKNSLFRALTGAAYVLPEVVLIEEAGERFVQLNSTEPIPDGAIDALLPEVAACDMQPHDIPYSLVLDSRQEWYANVADGLRRIRTHELDKVVLARELRVETDSTFNSRDMLVNLMAARVGGTLMLHQIGDTFFVGATPELLVRKQGDDLTTMCLAGTVPAGDSEKDRADGAAFLLNDPKNLREHAFVVEHLTGCLEDVCSELDMPDRPGILSLKHLQHLCTPVTGKVAPGLSLIELRDRLHPTPALAGSPVDKAVAAIREMESFNRGFYGGPFGYVDFDGNGEFSVAIRSGVFSSDYGYVYAGCGIVEGSDPISEYKEIDVKLKTILSAFQGSR